MKKNLCLVLVCMFAVVTLMSGCSLVTLNQGKYLSQVVASVGDIEITKEELITTYNSYYETLSEQGYTQNDMVDYSLDLLIDRAILEEYSQSLYTLTQAEKNETLIQAYDFIVSQIGELEGEVRAEWNISSSNSTETATSNTVYNEYEPIANFVDGQIVVVEDAEADNTPHFGFEDKVKGFKSYWVYEREDVANEAYKRYIQDLRDYEELKGINTESDDEVLLNEINRLYELYEKQAYLTRLQTEYNKSLVSSITPDMVLQEYQRLVNENKGRYDVASVGMDAYVTDMLDNASDVYYHPTNGEFFYVTHVLLKFSDEQDEKLQAMKSLLEQKAITQADYDNFMEELAKEIKVNVLDENGNATGEVLSVNEAYNNISASVQAGSTLREKAINFNQYIYSYNQDPGIQNAEKDYVIGKKIDEETETRSRMVESFTNASRDLYDQYLKDGVLGNISGLVLSENGYHIIMLTGVAENMVVSTNPIEACEDLNNYYVNAHTNETYFHKIFDSLVSDDKYYDTYVNGILTDYKSQNQITKFVSRYSDLKV